ncbi:substrate-binding domain-containing protein [Paenibacillus sp. FSL L8-0436]|uniref:PstS family phosphate ABC transporter substrate-binding protein n=1 Tax=Paenibacillus sp. FSL L8-0436 TaxID=2954686 RepID=UPI00315909CD
MKRPLGTSLPLSFIAVAAIAFAETIAYFVISLFGGMQFYAPLSAVAAFALAVYAVLAIFDLFNLRIRRIVFASFAGVCLLAAGVYEINQAYVNSLAEVNDREISLEKYKPFQPESKIAILDQTSTYKITDELPRLDGATALYPLYSAFVQAVYPKDDYSVYDFESSTVACTSTSTAYERLIDGDTDIIFAAAPSLSQQKSAKAAGKELVLTPIGREAFVFFVHKRNKVDGLTTQQIKDIYSGKLTNWKQVGGKRDSIRAFQREENSGSQTMLEKIMEGTPLMAAPQKDVMDVMSGIISQTASYRNYKNALGFSFLFYASEMNSNNEIKLLAVDGVEPGRESIRNGAYPFASEFYAVTAGSSNPHIQPFLNWIVSPEGQELVEKTGYTPVK